MQPVDFLSFIETLTRVSSEALLPFFRSSIGVENKASSFSFDPVTEADRAAERIMRHKIRATFPNHGIIGEEFGEENTESEYVWVIDPIDGTRSFICGFPVWGTLIALQHHGRPCYGLVHQPFTGEKFYGDGECSFWRHLSPGVAPLDKIEPRRLRTRKCTRLEEATLMTTHPVHFKEEEWEAFRGVESRVRFSRYGGDCYAYCMLAAGHIDLVIEAGLKPYDIAALIPIVTGAGGIITTWEGKEATRGGRIIAAGDPYVYEAACALLHGH